MTDDRYLELMQREIDGECSTEESALLRAHLSGNAEAAERFAELVEIAEALGRIAESDPPSDLRASILDRTDPYRTTGRRKTGGRLARLQSILGIAEGPTGIGGVPMSKKIIFVGGGIVVVVAIVAWFGLTQRPADGDEVTGAIGAVEKYREDQIGDEDVVLGESGGAAGHVPFGDLLTDAAVLENASTQLEAAVRDLEAGALEAVAFREKLNRLDRDLNGHAAALDARLQMAARAQLAAVRQSLAANASALEASSLESMRAELSQVQGALEAKALEAATLESARVRLAALSDDLGSRLHLDAMSLDRARGRLEAVSTGLDNRAKELDRQTLNQMQADLEATSGILEANAATLEARMLKARAAHLEALSLQASTLLNVRRELSKVGGLEAMQLQGMRPGLEARAQELSERSTRLEAQALASMKAQLDAFSLEQATLDSMSQSLSLGRRALEARADTLEAMTLDNLNVAFSKVGQRMQTGQLAASQMLVGEMRTQLAAASRCLNNAQLEARMMVNISDHLGMVRQRLDANRGRLEAQTLQSMRQQLDAMSRQIESRSPALN